MVEKILDIGNCWRKAYVYIYWQAINGVIFVEIKKWCYRDINDKMSTDMS